MKRKGSNKGMGNPKRKRMISPKLTKVKEQTASQLQEIKSKMTLSNKTGNSERLNLLSLMTRSSKCIKMSEQTANQLEIMKAERETKRQPRPIRQSEYSTI